MPSTDSQQSAPRCSSPSASPEPGTAPVTGPSRAWRGRTSRTGRRSAAAQVRQAEKVVAVPALGAAVAEGRIRLEHAAAIGEVATTGTAAQQSAARALEGQNHLLHLAEQLDAGTFNDDGHAMGIDGRPRGTGARPRSATRRALRAGDRDPAGRVHQGPARLDGRTPADPRTGGAEPSSTGRRRPRCRTAARRRPGRHGEPGPGAGRHQAGRSRATTGLDDPQRGDVGRRAGRARPAPSRESVHGHRREWPRARQRPR